MPDSISNPLGVILTAVYADYSELGRKLLFQLPQLRKYVNAVDSAVCPEVEQDDFSAEIREPERPVSGVNPIQISRKIGRPDRGHCGRICH
jgi:hypothetical protein